MIAPTTRIATYLGKPAPTKSETENPVWPPENARPITVWTASVALKPAMRPARPAISTTPGNPTVHVTRFWSVKIRATIVRHSPHQPAEPPEFVTGVLRAPFILTERFAKVPIVMATMPSQPTPAKPEVAHHRNRKTVISIRVALELA